MSKHAQREEEEEQREETMETKTTFILPAALKE